MTRLVIATVLLAALALVLRKRAGGTIRQHAIRVPARAALHRGASIAVVEVDGRRLLVGAGATGVSLLAELDSQPTIDVSSTQIPATAPRRSIAAPTSAAETNVSPSLHHAPVVVDTEPASVLDRLRRATTRTADPLARAARSPLARSTPR